MKLTRDISLILIAVLVGCSGEKDAKYAELSSGDVLVEVNGTKLVKAKLERDVKFRVALEAHRNKNFTDAAAKQMERKLYEQGIHYFTLQQAYKAEAAARGIVISADDMKAAHRRFLRRYAKGKGAATKWDDFIKKFEPALAEGLDGDLSFEALRFKVDAALRELPVEPMPADELEKLHAARTAFHARQTATNALIYATASNAWQRILAKKSDFSRIGKELAAGNEHIMFEEKYGPVEREFFKEETELFNLLPQLAINGITPPVENDNGLAILKLQAIDKNVPFGTTPRQTQYVFSRIFFELPEIEEQYTKEELGKAIMKQRAGEMPKKIIDARMKAMNIVYPNGKIQF